MSKIKKNKNMKYLAFIIWLIITLLIICTLVGALVIVVIELENTQSSWLKLGEKILNSDKK